MLLIQWYHEQDWVDFRGEEFTQLLAMEGVALEVRPACNSMLLCVSTPIDLAVIKAVCSRAVLVKAVYQLEAKADGVSELASAMEALSAERVVDSTSSWALNVECINRSMAAEVKAECRERFKDVGMTGPIKLVDPDIEFRVIFEFPWGSSVREASDAEVLSRPCFLGRVLAQGGMRAVLKKYDLKTRPYVGPTSLDHKLAMLCANITRVQAGALVVDPFVGTASLLVAASHFGATCFGSDIDIRVLKGDMYAGHLAPNDGGRRDIFGTFDTYSLPRPELVRMDNSIVDRHLHQTARELFDVILTDPPYGIRAGARKSGRADSCDVRVIRDRANYYPATQQYAMEEVMLDLLHSSAELLRIGGLLAYILPTPYDFSTKDLPKHPCLELVSLCSQSLSTRHGRHLVVMRKTESNSAATGLLFAAYKRDVLSGRDEGFGRQMGKLAAALSSEALADDGVLKRVSNRCAKRKANKQKHVTAMAVATARYAARDEEERKS